MCVVPKVVAVCRFRATVLDDDVESTDVWFHIVGPNLDLGDDGQVQSISDAASTLDRCLTLCSEQGHGRPATLTN